MEFAHEGTSFELGVLASTSALFRIWVDGVPHNSTPVQWPGANDNIRYIKFTFGSRAYREILIEGSSFFLGEMRTNNVDIISVPAAPQRPRVLLISDSYGVGSSASGGLLAYPTILGRLLNWDINQGSSVGSTGFLETAGGKKYRDRLTRDLAPFVSGGSDAASFTYNAVLLQGSGNDQPYAASLQTEVITTVNAIRAVTPTLPIIFTSHLYVASDSAYTATYNALKAAATSVSSEVTFIDTRSPNSWGSGTGTSTANTGDGAADIHMNGADFPHPTAAGHAYLARRLAASIRQIAGT